MASSKAADNRVEAIFYHMLSSNSIEHWNYFAPVFALLRHIGHYGDILFKLPISSHLFGV